MAQKKIEVKYFINNTEQSTDGLKMFIKSDENTIELRPEKGKIRLPKDLEKNFYLYAEVGPDLLKVGAFRPETFEECDGIIVGRITDFSTLKKKRSGPTFRIGKEYLVTIPEYENISDVVYGLIQNDIDISTNSNFFKYLPTFTHTYTVVKGK